MGHGGFKLQVQQRIFKTSDEIPWKKPWKRWKTKNVSHFPTALLRLSIRIHSRSLLHLEFECAHPAYFPRLTILVFSGLTILVTQVPIGEGALRLRSGRALGHTAGLAKGPR